MQLRQVFKLQEPAHWPEFRSLEQHDPALKWLILLHLGALLQRLRHPLT
jgi:hypothetical protein